MKETIVCIGRIANEPYTFADTGVKVSSYEELCYYMGGHMLSFLYTLPDESLLLYIRDSLGLDKLYRQLAKLDQPEKDQMKYFAALFREGNYYSEEQIRDLLDEFRRLKNAPYAMQCKWTGDMLLSHHRAARAIRYYKEALLKGAGDATEAGKIHHNMGIAQARLFRFEEARIHFLKAYQKTEDVNSLFYYFCLIALRDGVEAALDEMHYLEFSNLAIDSFEGRFLSFMDSFRSTEMADKYQRMIYMKENGREEDMKAMKEASILELQRQFRPEMETGEPIAPANLPASV